MGEFGIGRPGAGAPSSVGSKKTSIFQFASSPHSTTCLLILSNMCDRCERGSTVSDVSATASGAATGSAGGLAGGLAASGGDDGAFTVAGMLAKIGVDAVAGVVSEEGCADESRAAAAAVLPPDESGA